MKTKIKISLFAAIAAIALFFGTSAFKKSEGIKNKKEKVFTTVFFRFDPADGNETAYKLDNYTYMGEEIPGSSGCSEGDTDFCIVYADATTLGITDLDDAQDREDKLVTYLNGLSGGATPATTYLNNHWNSKKP